MDLILNTGLRMGEVLALKWSDINFDKKTLTDIKVISELLGHSSTEITYKVYIHVIDSLKESAVEAIDLD